jgi:uncharacterized protein YabE (DUF348 family)
MHKKLHRFRIKFRRFSRRNLPQNSDDVKTMSRHPHAVPVITIGLLLIVTLGGYFIARHTHRIEPHKKAFVVIVSYDHQKQVIPSHQQTVGELLVKLHIPFAPGDVVEPAANSVINQDDYRINVYRALPVQVVDGAQKTFAFSAATTPRSIAQQTGQQLSPEDFVNTIPAQNFIESGAIGEQVVIDRATPVNTDLYGVPVVLRTHAKTVGAMMKEKNIKLTKQDRVSVPPTTPITPGMQVAFLRTGSRTETRVEAIPTPVQTINDNSLAYGTSAVRQQGSPGEQTVTYQVVLNNNVETGRSVIQKVITKNPVTQITVMGTNLSGIKGDMALAGIAPGDYKYADYIIGHESGWNPAARNPSGAFGLCQALPGSKMSSAGADWATNPVTQLKWCNGYATSRYGGWAGAYNHWLATHNW